MQQIWVQTSLPPWPSLLCDDSMYQNRHAQVLVCAATLANWHALLAALPDALQQPALVLGYSVGELSACGVAGMLPAAALLQLAQQRAHCMDAAARQAQCLLAVQGTQALPLAALLQGLEWHQAIHLSPRQAVLGGPLAQLATLQQRLQDAAISTQRLPVSVAAHTPWMQAAQAPFAAVLAQQAWQAPHCGLLSGCDGQRLYSVAQVQQALCRQLAQTLDWDSSLQQLAESGVRAVLELGPGQALATQLAQRGTDLPVRALTQFQSPQGAAAWLQRCCDV